MLLMYVQELSFYSVNYSHKLYFIQQFTCYEKQGNFLIRARDYQLISTKKSTSV